MTIYRSGSGSLTPEQLSEYSGRIAAYFQRRGVKYAAVISGKSPLVYAAARACGISHTCFIPVDEALPVRRRELVAADADEIFYDSAEISGEPGWTDLREIVEVPGSAEVPDEDPGAPAYRIYTSGTTGSPKGIEVSRGNLRSFLDWFVSIPAIADVKPRSVLNQAMFSFDLSVADLWYSMRENAALTVIERSLCGDFSGMFRRMGESGAELAVLTPAFAELCMCDSAFCRELLPGLKVLFFCGEVLKPVTAAKLFGRFPGVRIVNAYGPTETCCAVAAVEITPEMAQWEVLPIGDMRHTAGEIHIDAGEIVITGESVARYTAGSGGFGEFCGERCFRTGDGGEIRDGMLWFRGRLDRQLKVMGYRIEPEDIENNMLKIHGVKQALVSVSPRGGRITAQAVAEGITAAEIRARLSELVPVYMLPGKITIVESLPVSGSFKLRRDLVQES